MFINVSWILINRLWSVNLSLFDQVFAGIWKHVDYNILIWRPDNYNKNLELDANIYKISVWVFYKY